MGHFVSNCFKIKKVRKMLDLASVAGNANSNGADSVQLRKTSKNKGGWQ
jgi:hypothetical protein